MTLRLTNTATWKKETFAPLDPPNVSLYSCGPTVYARAHIGNLRAYVFVDLLRRVLALNQYAVTHIMNITDVGHLTDDADQGADKVEQQAARENRSAIDIAREHEQEFKSDLHDLNILEPTQFIRATEHIAEQIALIQTLEQRGATYRTNDGVYFDTSTFPDYGKMARLDVAGLKPGARVEVNAAKRHPTDFALWKFTPPGVQRQMEWDSPWGRGFPGWHIECSAMALATLGNTIDIHTGGIDHIPVHHTNEIAQSETATGQPFVRFWLHNEHLVIDQGRMGKSEGNALTLETLKRKGFSPLAYRFWLLQTHYRTKLNFTWDALEAAQRGFEHLCQRVRDLGQADPAIGCAEYEQRFFTALNNDLDSPKALAIMWEMLGADLPASAKLRSLLTFDQALGLGLGELKPVAVPPEVQKLVTDRESARTAKDWKRADDLRKQIKQAGFGVDDTETGSMVKEG